MTDDLVRRLRELDTWVETAHTPVEAADRIEALEREKREAALDAIAAMGQSQEAYEAQLKAEAKLAEVERERDEWKSRHFKMRDDRDKAKIAARNYSEFNHEWRKRADAAEAKLAKALVALRGASSFLWHMTNAIDDEDYKGPHDGFNVPLVCHVQPYHDLHVEQLKTQAENVNAVLAEIEGRGISMTDDDLIRRGDALKITRDRWAAHMEKAQRVRELDDQSAARETERLSHFAREADTIRLAIAALPAQGVRVRALEWADYEEIVRDAQSGMHYASRALNGFNAYFVMQDGEQFWWWTSGHQTDHSVAHPTFDAAKAAAQADYERRILAALAPASGGVEATEDVGILRARVDELQRLNADLTRQVQMQPRRPQDAAPATDAVDALVKAAEALEKAREILIKHGYPKDSILIGYLDAAIAAIRRRHRRHQGSP